MAMWTHTVRTGDTISRLAKEYQSSVKAITSANGIANSHKILPGQQIVVPGPDFSYPPEELAQWAKLLFTANSSPLGEMTAITQYSFQSVVWDNLEAKKLLIEIARDEMEHLNTVSQILQNIGFEPRYWVVEPQVIYWNSSFINYSRSPQEMLEADIHSEYHAIKAYKELIAQVADPFIQHRITHILKEEEEHARRFEQLLKKIKGL
jgi:bacterioferritin